MIFKPRPYRPLFWSALLLFVISLACRGAFPQTEPPAPPQESPPPFPTTPPQGPLIPPTQIPSDQIEPLAPPFGDDFSDPGTGWYTERDETIILDYESGGFRMFLDEINMLAFSTVGVKARDVVIEVQAEKIGGPDDNSFGVLCRQRGETYYYFEISSDGFFKFARFIEDDYTELFPWSETDAIRQGEATNHIRVECVGNTFRMFVNGVLLLETNDEGIQEAGFVGLLAGTFETPGVDILFDDFLALEP